ncbi:TraB/GumN family protein [Halovulum sp. GXIMD14793]
MIQLRRCLFRLSLLAATLISGQAAAFCEGRDLLAEMPQTTRDRLAEVSTQKYATGRYWQVEKGGNISALFGTIHLPDEDISAVPDALKERIERARLVMIELTKGEEQRMQQAIMRPPSIIRNPEGRRLSQELPSEEWAQVQAALSQYGLTAPVVDQMEPWFLGMMLSIPPCVTRAQLAGQGILDRNIETLARESGVLVEGLETYQEVLDLLVGSSYEDGLAQLVTVASTISETENYMATLTEMYKRGDIQAIWELSVILTEEVMGPQGTAMLKTFNDRLLKTRNENWADTLFPALEQGNVVVAVGALHLGGPHGLLQMLEDEGFTVRRLDG